MISALFRLFHRTLNGDQSQGDRSRIQGVPLGNIPKANMGIVNNKGFEVEARYQSALRFQHYRYGKYRI